ncbi:MAG: sulfonate ABC transporter permease [Rhizobiales bacterium 32-66-8]|nr:MAG: sulfonate ABC transporter permease [Rhizobiales bacterium 32-66-8]
MLFQPAGSSKAPASVRRRFFSVFDLFAFAVIFGLLALFTHGTEETLVPISQMEQTPISLDPWSLPEYSLRTTLRMLAAIVASLLFTFLYGALAAKSRRAEMVLIPILDILQSVPVLGFLSFTVLFFMGLFPRSFRLTGWQRFWRLEVPFSMPGLVWNTMMSMSGGWFFVVASEAITVGNTTISLPGVGAYVATAIDQRDLTAVGWSVLAMLVIILIYDQLLFRPLVAWAEKFRFEQSAGGPPPRSWVLDLVKRAHLFQLLISPFAALLRTAARMPLASPVKLPQPVGQAWASPIMDRVWAVMVGAVALYGIWTIYAFVSREVGLSEAGHVVWLGFLTLLRVAVLIFLASLVWVPIGVWIGLNPKVATAIQPLAQFLAAFPANIVFPFAVVAIVHFKLDPNIWLSPLMILGTQWYILFNVIAGASAFPTDMREAASAFHIRGWHWWTKVILPGVFPYYVTGALTASGGSWNAAIVAEVASWGDTTLRAEGLGAYIADATTAADYPRITLGIAVMSLYVIAFNRTLWRPMFSFAARRLRMD